MATISLVLRAVDNASKGLLAVAANAGDAANRIDGLNDKIGKLDDAMAGADASARLAESGLKSVGREADVLAGKLVILNGRLDELDRTVTARVKVKVDESALSRLRAQLAGGSSGNSRTGLSALLPGGARPVAALANPYVAGGAAAAVAGVLPFIAQQASSALVLGLGAGLAGLGIAGALTTGTAPKAPAPNAVATAQLKLQAAQQKLAQLLGGSSATPAQIAAAQASLTSAQGRLAGLGAPTAVSAATRKADQLKVTAAQDRLTSALNKLAQLQAPGSKATQAQIAAAQSSIASSQASVVSAQAKLAGLGAPKAVAPGVQAADQLKVTAAQDRLNALLGGKSATPAQITAARASVSSAQGALTKVQQQQSAYNDYQQTYKLQLQAQAAFSNLSSDAQASLAQIGKSFVPVMLSIFNTADSVLKRLTPVFAAADKTIAGPFQLFSDTLIKSFNSPQVKTSVQAVAGAFGKLLTALAPGLPGDVNEIATGITKVANAVAANPQAFATFINDLFKLAQVGLSVVADLTRVASYIEAHFRPALHDTANDFDGVRHEVAHIADDMASALIRTYEALYNDIIGSTIRFGHNVETQYNSVTHESAVIFDGMRGELGRIYNGFWNDTLGATIRFGHNVETQFDSLRHSVAVIFDGIRHDISGIFSGAGTWLLNAGKSVVQGLVNGILSAPGAIVSAIESLVPSPLRGVVASALHLIGFASGTAYAPAGWAWVGERGPELMRFRGGERVLSSPVSAALAASPSAFASSGIVADTGTILSPGWNMRYNGTGGPEPLVPAGAGGPLIHIGEMHVHDESDVALVAQRLSGMIRAASLGGGFRH